MEQSHSWEADRCSASHYMPRRLLNPKASVFTMSRHLTLLSQINTVQLRSPEFKLHILPSCLNLCLSSGVFLSGFMTKVLCAVCISPSVILVLHISSLISSPLQYLASNRPANYEAVHYIHIYSILLRPVS